jgi:hexulose-6-phosphate isomerase
MQGRLSPLYKNKIQSFPWDTWQDEFQIASINNFKIIEWTIDDHRLYENPLLSDSGIKEIKRISDKYGIKIPSLTGDCFMQNPFWKAEGKKKDYLHESFIRILHACNKLNISIILIPLVDNGSLENEVQEDNLLNFLNLHKGLISKLSLRICFESDYPPQKLKNFIDKFDKDLFGINYDTGNSASLGFDPVEEFSMYGDRIINVHIKDRPMGGGTVPLGNGDTDFQLIFNLLKEYGYSGNLILQTARSKNNDHLGVLIDYYKMTLQYAKESGLLI